MVSSGTRRGEEVVEGNIEDFFGEEKERGVLKG